jgi:hypothetical protein
LLPPCLLFYTESKTIDYKLSYKGELKERDDGSIHARENRETKGECAKWEQLTAKERVF